MVSFVNRIKDFLPAAVPSEKDAENRCWYGLWQCQADGTPNQGDDCWVRSIDFAGDPIVAFDSLEEAMAEAEYSVERWRLRCTPRPLSGQEWYGLWFLNTHGLPEDEDFAWLRSPEGPNDPIQAFRSLTDAQEAAEYQTADCDLPCTPRLLSQM